MHEFHTGTECIPIVRWSHMERHVWGWEGRGMLHTVILLSSFSSFKHPLDQHACLPWHVWSEGGNAQIRKTQIMKEVCIELAGKLIVCMNPSNGFHIYQYCGGVKQQNTGKNKSQDHRNSVVTWLTLESRDLHTIHKSEVKFCLPRSSTGHVSEVDFSYWNEWAPLEGRTASFYPKQL